MAQSLTQPDAGTAQLPKRGRKPKDQNPGLGHNTEPLTEEEQEALQLHHELKIRAQQKKADAAKATYDLERNEVNSLVKIACGEMKVPAGEFRSYMEDKNLSETEYRQKAMTRALLRKRGGMPDAMGQYSLDLPTKADTADETALAYQDGFRAGKRADDPIPPKHIAAVMHTEWMRGWHAGQEDNAKKLGIAEAVIARRSAPKTDEPPASEEPDLDPATIDAEARKLKRKGFLNADAPAQDAA